MKTVYKVVKTMDYGSLRSFTSSLSVLYRKDMKTVKPEFGGPLCAFETYDDAIEFMGRYIPSNLQVWRCDAIPTEYKRGVWMYNSSFLVPLRDLPNGTILCDEITLRERIK